MLERDAFGDNTAWQDVYRSLNQLLGHLRIAILKRKSVFPGKTKRLLDIQTAQAQIILHVLKSHLERLDDDAEWFDTAGGLGQLYGPLLGIGHLRHLHKQNLEAYVELLQAYLQLLEETHDGVSEPEQAPPKRETYTL